MAKTSEARREPRVGAVILYVDAHMGDCYPGIVTRVLTDGKCLLTVFEPGTTPRPVLGPVEHDPEGKRKGTWHWSA